MTANITDAPADLTVTRDEAIELVVTILTRATVAQGADLAQVIGAELAANMTVWALEQNQAALDALGVSEDDVRRVAEAIEARQRDDV